jgi:DNA-binding CsgD family transcriptional regulator
MIELVKAKTKAQQIRDYVAANPNATPTEIAEAMGVNRQYIYTVMYKVKAKAGVKKGKKLGRPRKVTEASENLKRLVDEYKQAKATKKAEVDLSPALKFLDGRAQAKGWKTVSITSTNAPIQGELFDAVNHPAHYKVGGIETIDFIEAKKLNYNIGNVVKYITRADHKGNRKQDLEKALWYLNREISALK